MIRGFRFEAVSEKGKNAIKDSILLKKGASKWEKSQFKWMWSVEPVSDDPYTLDVLAKSKALAKRIQPDIFIGTFKRDLLLEHGVSIEEDYKVEVLE